MFFHKITCKRVRWAHHGKKTRRVILCIETNRRAIEAKRKRDAMHDIIMRVIEGRRPSRS